MTEMSTETDFFTQWAEDLDIPCSYAEEPTCSKGAAKWIMKLVPCCSGMVQTLACDSCKEVRVQSEDGIVCDRCNAFTAPARYAYYAIEAL